MSILKKIVGYLILFGLALLLISTMALTMGFFAALVKFLIVCVFMALVVVAVFLIT